MKFTNDLDSYTREELELHAAQLNDISRALVACIKILQGKPEDVSELETSGALHMIPDVFRKGTQLIVAEGRVDELLDQLHTLTARTAEAISQNPYKVLKNPKLNEHYKDTLSVLGFSFETLYKLYSV